MFKKMISILVSAAMTIGCGTGIMPDIADIAAAVAADEEALEYDGWQYVLVDGGARVVKHDMDEEAEYRFDNIVTLPTKLDGKKVVSFAQEVFAEDKFTRMISVPDNTVEFDDDWLDGSQIYYIYYEDFQFALLRDSRNLKLTKWSKKRTNAQNPSDDEPEPVIIEETTSAVPLAVSNTEVYDLVIPEKVAGYTVSGFEYNALTGAVNIGKLTLPDTITTLSKTDLMNTSITSVNIPKVVRYVQDDCFKGCTQLSEVKFHDDILIVSAKAFPDSPNVVIPPEYDDPYATAYSSSMQSHGTKRVGDWVLYFYDFSGKETTICLREYLGSDTVLTVPSEVGGYTINGAERLERILANNTTVEEVLFDEDVKKLPTLGSANVKKVTIPDTVTEISWEFIDCTGLTSVVIPSSVTKIVNNAFAGCTNLREITIQGSEMKLGSGKALEAPFDGTAIEKLELPGNCTVNQVKMPETLKEIMFGAGDLVTYKGGAYTSSNLSSVTFDPDIRAVVIGASAFRDSKLEKIVFPNGKVTVEANAFRGCVNLKEVVFNGEVEIASNAFSECPQLEKVLLGDKCKVADLAFSECPKLAEVDFDTAQDISARVFNWCPNLYVINGIEVVPEGSCEPADEFRDYFYKNCHTAHEVGFVDRFTMNNVKRVAAETVDDSMSDIEKAKALHDWVCENTVYDGENEDALGNHVDSAVFMDGVAVCEGYAMAYDLLLHEVGIQSAYVCTKDHAWNLVKLGGKWFHADTTWDDGESYSHSWFLCPDSDMTADIRKGYDISAPSYLHDFQPSELPVCDTLMGDVNGDGMVDSKDATDILAEYSRLSTGADAEFDELQAVVGDVSVDGRNDSMDASKILRHYSVVSTGGTDSIMN